MGTESPLSDESFLKGVPRAKGFNETESENSEKANSRDSDSQSSSGMIAYIQLDEFLRLINEIWYNFNVTTFNFINIFKPGEYHVLQIIQLFMHCLGTKI